MPVTLDDRSAELGGCFWQTPLTVYDRVPIQWAYDMLLTHERPVMLDIGASTGCFTLLAKYVPDLIVHAVEPFPLAYGVLSDNVRLNNLAHTVALLNFAMSDTLEIGLFHVAEPVTASGLSMLGGNPNQDRPHHDIAVHVYTIDYLYEMNHTPQWTLIKIDVEGNELAVLRGGEKTIRTLRPALIVEASDINAAQYGYTPADIETLLREWGYAWTSPNGCDLLCTWKG
jgi:FkbM family methyltransferase